VVEIEGKKIVPWHGAPPISDFYYSWSHSLAHSVKIPKGCFTMTILRDPVDRFISRARDLKKHEQLGNLLPGNPSTVDHQLGVLLRKGLLGAARACLPGRERLCFEQLYHFSPTGDIDEAIEMMKGLSYVFRIEKYEEGLGDLRELLCLELPHLHLIDKDIPKETYREVATELTPQVIEELREMFIPEYKLLERLNL